MSERGFEKTGSSANVLVIKLGALGDFVQAMGPFSAIREHHANDKITLLTSAPYVHLAEACGFFDKIWVDEKPKISNPKAWLDLRRRLRGGNFDRVYDLQTSDRSSWYFHLFKPGASPQWSGIAKGCSHPHANPKRDLMHTLERQAEQLRMAGVEVSSVGDLSFIKAPLKGAFDLTSSFALLVPGAAAQRPAKRWAAENFGALATWLDERKVMPVLLGAAEEKDLLEEVRKICPAARNLAGKTDLVDIIALASQALVGVGNDTGPMHLIAANGCSAVVLFSSESDPAICAPRGRDVTILRQHNLADISAGDVTAILQNKIADGRP
jgi:ADP-heptose:LPS heptosyltransferase